MASSQSSSEPEDGVSIIDIRQNEIGFSIFDDLQQGLRPVHGEEKRMPTMLLYNEKGLKLFEEITYLDEYYLTNAEIEVLERYADQIAERIPYGSQIVELGSGYAAASQANLLPIDSLGKASFALHESLIRLIATFVR